jgi:hypothetical protein
MHILIESEGSQLLSRSGAALARRAPSAGNKNQTGGNNTLRFNFDRLDHATMDFHPPDVLQLDEPIYANAQMILNVLHDDEHGTSVIAVDGHDAISMGGAVKAHLHGAEFHLM